MKQTPGDDQPAPARPVVAQVDGQLGGVGAGDQVGGAHQVDEARVGDPAAAADQLLAHHRGVGGRAAERDQAQPQEHPGDLAIPARAPHPPTAPVAPGFVQLRIR